MEFLTSQDKGVRNFVRYGRSVAAVMALDRAIRNIRNNVGSVYDDREILVF
ncbi:hypothetical protein RZO55_12195 [Clostridium boliviensis]|uniref:Uncharacterized protein n=1 Tax=Clostridium boliviensis TaxID=318465 RepID=A0ABU4GL45_9CLOT|nr:hypothetical protein [Clostridium boliviensis]MDW2798335.1 hypothetical protein [Clostridium boliviensis]